MGVDTQSRVRLSGASDFLSEVPRYVFRVLWCSDKSAIREGALTAMEDPPLGGNSPHTGSKAGALESL